MRHILVGFRTIETIEDIILSETLKKKYSNCMIYSMLHIHVHLYIRDIHAYSDF